MRDYNEFKSQLKEEVEKAVDGTIKFQMITKTNVTVEEMVVTLEKGNIRPAVTLAPLYERYKEGYDVVSEAVNIVKEALRNCPDVTLNEDNFKANVIFSVMNADVNKELLETLPHFILVGDIAVYYRWVIKSETDGVQSAKVTHKLIQSMNIDEFELYKLAFRNTLLEKIKFIQMGEMLSNMMGIPAPAEILTTPMWVLSNDLGINGANVLALISGMYADKESDFKNVIAAFDINHRAELVNMLHFLEFLKSAESDLIILPSSTHEIIIIPESMYGENNDLVDLVEMVNATQVAPEERLSNSIFKLNRAKGCLEVYKSSTAALV